MVSFVSILNKADMLCSLLLQKYSVLLYDITLKHIVLLLKMAFYVDDFLLNLWNLYLFFSYRDFVIMFVICCWKSQMFSQLRLPLQFVEIFMVR